MRILKKLEEVVLWIASCMFFVLIFIVLFQIASRNLMGKSYAQLEEFSIILLPWFGFFAATYTLYRGNHVEIDFIYNAFPSGMRKVLDVLTQVAILVLILGLAWFSWGLSMRQMKLVTPALGWPMGVQYLGFPLCAPFMLPPVLYRLHHCIFHKSEATEEVA